MQCKESFTGYYPVLHERSAEGLKNHIVSLFERKGPTFQRCRGQGYDGAAVMCGAYK